MSSTLQVANLRVGRGSKAKGMLPLSDRNDGSPLETPVLVIHGRGAGPRLWITAAMHGDEHEGVQAVLELYDELDPMEISGSFVGMPVVNPLAYAQVSRTAPQDGVDPNTVFPGQLHGSITLRMACTLFAILKESADIHMDLHSGGFPLHLYPYALYHADGEAGEAGCSLALATGRDLIAVTHGNQAHGALYAELTKRGIPSIMFEYGGAGIIRSVAASKHKESILRAMQHLGMLPGRPRKPPLQRVIQNQLKLYAPVGGMVFFSVEAGVVVEERQELGHIVRIDGTVKHVLTAPCNGFVTYYRAIPVVSPGDLVSSIWQVVDTLDNGHESMR